MATPFPFVSGNTLTAAQLNAITTLPVSTKTTSYTLTVADLGTRVVMNSASATTITVNTSIFGASDVVEILNIGAGVCTITAGTATVTTSGTLALAQNAGGNLIFISASAAVFFASGVAATASAVTLVETLSPSAASTASFTTGKISSSYSYYTIFYKLDKTFSINLRSGGSTITGANYAGQGVGATTASATVNSVVSAQTSWAIYDSTAPSTISNTLSFFNYDGSASQFPTLVQYPTFLHWSAATFATLSVNWQYGATQAVDSLLFTSLNGTFSGTIKLYGWS